MRTSISGGKHGDCAVWCVITPTQVDQTGKATLKGWAQRLNEASLVLQILQMYKVLILAAVFFPIWPCDRKVRSIGHGIGGSGFESEQTDGLSLPLQPHTEQCNNQTASSSLQILSILCSLVTITLNACIIIKWLVNKWLLWEPSFLVPTSSNLRQWSASPLHLRF